MIKDNRGIERDIVSTAHPPAKYRKQEVAQRWKTRERFIEGN